MRYLVTAAAAAMLSAGAAQAAVVDLTYTIEAEVVDYFYTGDNITPYPGPMVGDSRTFVYDIAVDTSTEFGDANFDGFYPNIYRNFDSSDGSGDFTEVTSADTQTQYFLKSGMTGTITDTIAFYDIGFRSATVNYNVSSWSVEGPPAPVPLPAALPLLAVGLAGLGWVARRRP